MDNINVKVIYRNADTKEFRKGVVEIGCTFPKLGQAWEIVDKCLMSGLADDNGKIISRFDIVEVVMSAQNSINPDDSVETHFIGLVDYVDGHFFVREATGKYMMPLYYSDYTIKIIGDNFTDSHLLTDSILGIKYITENQDRFYAIKEMNHSYIKNVRLYTGTDNCFETTEDVENMYNSGKHFTEMSGIDYNNCKKINIAVK